MTKRFVFSTFLAISSILFFIGYLILSARYRVIEIKISDAVIKAKVADTPAKQTKGLQGVKSLQPNEGMLFVFPSTDFHVMWMDKTKLELDIIWLDENKKVVGIAHRVSPCTSDPCPVYKIDGKSRYVLELVGGSAESFGIELGDLSYWE